MQRELQLELEKLRQQNILEKQAANEERARKGMMHATLGDVSCDELRAYYVEYIEMVDNLLSNILQHKNTTSTMKKSGMFGGDVLGNNDTVLYTKSETNEYDADIEKQTIECSVAVINMFHKMGIATASVVENYDKRLESATVRLEEERKRTGQRKRPRAHGGCHCTTSCGSRCGCVKSGLVCDAHCSCGGNCEYCAYAYRGKPYVFLRHTTPPSLM